MNKDYMFLKNLYTLLEAGYSVEDALNVCSYILKHPVIKEMQEQLAAGYSLERILSSVSLPKLFKEYFAFFQNKNCLSEAIEKSLDICITKQKYQNELKSKLTYPLVLLVFLFLFSIFVVFILLPNVNQLFDSFQIQKSMIIQSLFVFFYIMPIILIVLSVGFIYAVFNLLFALKHKSSRTIEKYLNLPIFKVIIQKYFSLKFAVYYHELLKEEMDTATIIALLSEQMNDSDIKIVLYEMNNRIQEGESLENILEDFEYLDPLFLSFFQMYIRNPIQGESLAYYIQITYEQIDLWISQFLKYLIPSVYAFVAIFVITIYISIVIPMMNVISDI